MPFEPEKYLRKRAQASYISTILGIDQVLSMQGIMAWILVNTRQISKKAKEQIFMDINFRESAKEADILQFEKTLKIEPYVRKSHYVDRDEISLRLDSLNIDTDSMLTDDEAKSIIPPHVELYLNEAWANPDSAQLIRETLMANRPDIVETITFNENMFRDVNNNVQKLAMVLGGLACVLLLVAKALINNTYSPGYLFEAVYYQNHAAGWGHRTVYSQARAVAAARRAARGVWNILPFSPVIQDEQISFTYFEPTNRAERVALVGSFNGWNPAGYKMSSRSPGLWQISISRPAGGNYAYKFLVDDHWVHDPENLIRVEDGYGGFSSILEVRL